MNYDLQQKESIVLKLHSQNDDRPRFSSNNVYVRDDMCNYN